MSLLEFSTKWSKSRLTAKPYMDFMQFARIDDGTWLSTSENFIRYWKYQHNMYQTESLRYNLFLDSELIAMLDASVCLIKELHHVKIQCDSDGSTYAAYVSCLINTASQYDSAPFTMTAMEIIQSTPKLLEPVLSDMNSQTDLFDFCFGDTMAHGESQLTVSIDITGSRVGPSCCEYKPFLPLYQCGYQSTPHVKLKDIQGGFSYYGAISSYGDQQSLVLWSLLNVKHCYVLMNDLYCSVLCDPRSHTDSVVDCLDHGEECTELPPMLDWNCNILQLHFTWLQTNVVKACLSYVLPCIVRNAASINTLVKSFVRFSSPKLERMSVRPYEEQPKSMMPVSSEPAIQDHQFGFNSA